jgi:nucleotide-binding universal stress UspA family protein
MYERILVPVDGSPTSDLGCHEALKIAKGLGSKLHFLNVVDPRLLFAEVSSKVGPQELLDIWRAGGERLVAQAVAAHGRRRVG